MAAISLRGAAWACNPPLRRASGQHEALPGRSSRARRQQRPLPPAAAAGPQASAPQQQGTAAEQAAAPPPTWSDDMQAEFEDYQREQAAAAEAGAVADDGAPLQADEQQQQEGLQESGEQQPGQGPPGGQWTAELEEEFQKYKQEQAAGEPAAPQAGWLWRCTTSACREILGPIELLWLPLHLCPLSGTPPFCWPLMGTPAAASWKPARMPLSAAADQSCPRFLQPPPSPQLAPRRWSPPRICWRDIQGRAVHSPVLPRRGALQHCVAREGRALWGALCHEGASCVAGCHRCGMWRLGLAWR